MGHVSHFPAFPRRKEGNGSCRSGGRGRVSNMATANIGLRCPQWPDDSCVAAVWVGNQYINAHTAALVN